MDAQELVGRIDARLYKSRIATPATIPGEVDPIRGTFHAKPREVELQDGSFIALDISFQCRITDAIRVLAEGDQIAINDVLYRFLRRIPDLGDESGNVILELGTVK